VRFAKILWQAEDAKKPGFPGLFRLERPGLFFFFFFVKIKINLMSNFFYFLDAVLKLVKTIKVTLKTIIFALLFLILGAALTVGFLFYQDKKETEYFKSLVKNHPEAEKFVEELLKAKGELKDNQKENDFSALLRIAVNLNLLGDKKLALRYYEKTLKKDPKNFLALNNVANLYSDLGDYQKAEEYFLRLISYYPDKTMPYRSLGYLYRYRLNKTPAEIEEFFKKGLEATNNHPDLLSWLIAYFQEIGDNYRFVKYANLIQEKSQKSSE